MKTLLKPIIWVKVRNDFDTNPHWKKNEIQLKPIDWVKVRNGYDTNPHE